MPTISNTNMVAVRTSLVPRDTVVCVCVRACPNNNSTNSIYIKLAMNGMPL